MVYTLTRNMLKKGDIISLPHLPHDTFIVVRNSFGILLLMNEKGPPQLICYHALSRQEFNVMERERYTEEEMMTKAGITDFSHKSQKTWFTSSYLYWHEHEFKRLQREITYNRVMKRIHESNSNN